MTLRDPEPWLPAAIALLDVRRQDRLLACGVGVEHARALAALVGREGEMVAVCDGADAEQLASLDLPQVQVLAHSLSGSERFGTFDALLAVSANGPTLPLGAYPELARSNLRPGGRLVIDVPGPTMVPELAAAWLDLGWDRDRLAPLCGIGDDTLADALRHAGLRNVHSVLGSHLVHAATPADLVQAYADALALADDEQHELAHALVRRQGSTDGIDALVHRTRLSALR